MARDRRNGGGDRRVADFPATRVAVQQTEQDVLGRAVTEHHENQDAQLQPPSPVPCPEVYAAVAARRTQFDNLLWQVPALSITGQAFLFTISLGAGTRTVARVVACILSLIVTFLTVQIFTRHRRGEVTDAHWLEHYEKLHDIPRAHGHHWRKLREKTRIRAGVFTPLALMPGYLTWAIGLSLFGVVAVVVLVLSLWWPQLLGS